MIDAEVADGLDDVAGAGLALGPDHARTLADAPQRLTEVGGAAHERHLERPLVDVMGLVGRGEDLGLVDVVDPERLEDLGFDEVPDPGLGHDGDGDGVLDALDHLRVGHAGHAAVGPDVGRDPLEGHDRHRTGVFGDLGLVGVDDVHDDAALEHLGQTPLDAVGAALVRWMPSESPAPKPCPESTGEGAPLPQRGSVQISRRRSMRSSMGGCTSKRPPRSPGAAKHSALSGGGRPSMTEDPARTRSRAATRPGG